jgi:protocatechuate 4,5-dioxygenase beta chain
MRGALDDDIEEIYRFYTVPASNTAVGHIILENKRRAAGKSRRPAAGKGKRPAAAKPKPKPKRAAARADHRNVRRGKR